MEREEGRSKLPKKEWEKSEGELNPTSRLKYSGEMSAPEDYDKSTRGLADYVKKHRMKY